MKEQLRGLHFMQELNQKLGQYGEWVIVIILGIMGMAVSARGSNSFLTYLQSYLPALIYLGLAIFAFYKKKEILSYTILLMSFYRNGINQLLNWIVGGFYGVRGDFDFIFILWFIIEGYILLQLAYHILQKPKLTWEKPGLEILVVLALFAFGILTDGASVAVNMMVIPVVALLFGAKFIAVASVIAETISAPFWFFHFLVSRMNITFGFVVYHILITAVLVFAILVLIRQIDRHEYNELK